MENVIKPIYNYSNNPIQENFVTSCKQMANMHKIAMQKIMYDRYYGIFHRLTTSST